LTPPTSPPTLPRMEPARDLGRMLLVLAAVLAVAGAILYLSPRPPFRLGRLPGDIVHRGEHTTFYFPLATSLLLSVGLSLVLWLIAYLRR
jgi:hypothetical protein